MPIKVPVFLFALACLAARAFAAPPANDNFSNAAVLADGVNATGTLDGATREPGDYDFGGSGYVPYTAWYQWTPTTSGVTHISVVFQSAQRHGLQAFAGDSLAAGKFLTDDGGDSYLYVVAGHTYHVSFDGASLSGFTIGQSTDASLPAGTLYIPPLSNDDSTQATVLPSQTKVDFVTYTFNATFEPGEYDLLDAVKASYSKGGDGGVWLDWTAPVTGSATFSAQNIANKKIVLLSLVDAGSKLDLAGGSNAGIFSFNCQQGTVYHLYVLNQSDFAVSASISAVASGGGGGGGGDSSTFGLQKGTFAGAVGDSGFLSVSLLASGHFTGTLLLNGASHPLNGAFKSDGNFAGQIGQPAFILSLHLDLAKSQAKLGDYVLTGSANGQAFSVSHATYGPQDLALEAGKYTLLLEASGSGAAVPTGAGYATLTVGPTGAVHLAGKLADGEPLAAAGVLVGNTSGKSFGLGKLLVYPSLSVKGTKGLGLGAVTFRSTTGGDFDGTVRWVKPAQTKGLHPAAIDTTLNVTGARYTFAKGDSVLPGFVSGTVALSDAGALATPLAKAVTLTSANAIVVTNSAADKLAVVIHPATGLFTGSFIYPGDTARTPITGALLQKRKDAAGFFLSPTRSGKLTLKAP